MDSPWKPLREKWDCGIDLDNATEREINDYVEAKAIIYEGEKLCDTALWEVFRIDFRHFTSSTFKGVTPLANQRLRSCLQRGGVFVTSTEGFEEGDPGDGNALTLEEVVKEKNKHKWTAEDVESIRETLEGAEPVFSRVLARGGLLKNLDVYYAPNCVMNYDIASLNLPSPGALNLPPPSVNLPSLTQANPLKSSPLTTTQLPA